LQVADGLIVDAKGVGQVLSGQSPLGAQYGQPVVEHRLGAFRRSRHHASAGGSGSIQASAAIGRIRMSATTVSAAAPTIGAWRVARRAKPRTRMASTTTSITTTADRI